MSNVIVLTEERRYATGPVRAHYGPIEAMINETSGSLHLRQKHGSRGSYHYISIAPEDVDAFLQGIEEARNGG